MTYRWLFGDQLGPHFLDDTEAPVLMIESTSVLRRRTFHRQKAHLVLSAMRHRAAELGSGCRYVRTETYRDGLAEVSGRLEVIQPTSWAAVRFVDRLASKREIVRHPARGFSASRAEFDAWAQSRGRRRLLLEDFYRDNRRRLGLLMDGAEPVGGRWNFDAQNREPPPKRRSSLGVPEPAWPTEDAIDAGVRADLDRLAVEGVEFLGEDGPRLFAATRSEALAALDDFIQHRLPEFGRYEDAMMGADRWMAHLLLSAPLNLGLLDPVEVASAVEQAYFEGRAPLAAVEGFLRQVIGWRDYIWHLYWYLGEDYRRHNALNQARSIDGWFAALDPEGTEAACVRSTLASVRQSGWAHHIPRLMVLGGYALQHRWSPQQVTDWFHRSFVDGYDWVMVPNVVGMSQHADGGILATKPYLSGGAYMNRMSDYCGGCRYDPKKRVGEDACPFTGGYWRFLHRHRERFEANPRMRPAIRGLDRLADLDQVLADEP
ncbi:MAG: cryptochrome/photolyase family protein [Microlunatus sp.]|nr:cryptochrome/photolyase family protein [Microlunatus sp.]MDN5770594.1 cryptochrome/photolyase family protein [Microlunatus sp.]MDN5803528.1 cryptochrome/photolyase family protein [Microlunatus sp.]